MFNPWAIHEILASKIVGVNQLRIPVAGHSSIESRFRNTKHKMRQFAAILFTAQWMITVHCGNIDLDECSRCLNQLWDNS